MTLKEAHARTRDAVKRMLMAAYPMTEERATNLADVLLFEIRAEFHMAGFVMAPKMATNDMIEKAWAPAMDEDAAGVWTAMLAARPKLEDQT